MPNISDTYPNLAKKFGAYDNFKSIVDAIEAKFSDLFQLDVLEEEAKNGENHRYSQFFGACVEKLRDCYTEGELVHKLHLLLNEDAELRSFVLARTLIVPPLEGKGPSRQIGFLEKIQTGTLNHEELLTCIDIRRAVNAMGGFHPPCNIFSFIGHISHLESNAKQLTDLAVAGHTPSFPELENYRILFVDLNQSKKKKLPKWSMVTIEKEDHLVRVYCEAALLQSEKKELERNLSIPGFAFCYEGAGAEHSASTGYTVLAKCSEFLRKKTRFATSNITLSSDSSALIEGFFETQQRIIDQDEMVETVFSLKPLDKPEGLDVILYNLLEKDSRPEKEFFSENYSWRENKMEFLTKYNNITSTEARWSRHNPFYKPFYELLHAYDRFVIGSMLAKVDIAEIMSKCFLISPFQESVDINELSDWRKYFSLLGLIKVSFTGEIDGKSYKAGDLSQLLATIASGDVSLEELKHQTKKNQRTFYCGLNQALVRAGILSESEKGATVTLTIPEKINRWELSKYHRSAIQSFYKNWELLLLSLYGIESEALHCFGFVEHPGPDDSELATRIIFNTIRTHANLSALSIELSHQIKIHEDDQAWIARLIESNGCVTDFETHGHPSLNAIKERLELILARNGLLKFLGYCAPVMDDRWGRLHKLLMSYLRDNSPFQDENTKKHFKDSIRQLGIRGLVGFLIYLDDPSERAAIKGILGKTRPTLYVASESGEREQCLEALCQHLGDGKYFPFGQIEIDFMPGLDEAFCRLIEATDALDDFKQITLTGCLVDESQEEDLKSFLITLAEKALAKEWEAIIVIPELENIDTISESLRDCRVCYTNLNNVILRNCREKAARVTAQRIQEIDEDAALPDAQKSMPVVAKNLEKEVRIEDSDSSNSFKGPWSLNKKAGVQVQLQQQQQIEIAHQTQQEQQIANADTPEEEAVTDLISYDTIDAFLKLDEPSNSATEQPVAEHETRLQAHFRAWIGADPRCLAPKIIRFTTQEAAERLYRSRSDLCSGLNDGNLPKGFYLQWSKDDELILCYKPELSFVKPETPLTLDLDARPPIPEELRGDFRQFNLGRYLSGKSELALDDEDCKNIMLFSLMQPHKDYQESFKFFIKQHPELGTMIKGKKGVVVRHWPAFLQAWQYAGATGFQQFLEKIDGLNITLRDAIAVFFRDLGSCEESNGPLAWAIQRFAESSRFPALAQVYYRQGESATRLLLSQFKKLEDELGRDFFEHFQNTFLNKTENFLVFLSTESFVAMNAMIQQLKGDSARRLAWQAISANHSEAVGSARLECLWAGFAYFVEQLGQLGLQLEGTEFDGLLPQNMLVGMDRILDCLRCLPDLADRLYLLRHLPEVDLTQGGLSYAFRHDGIRYFDEGLKLEGFRHGDPTYAPALERLYSWKGEDEKVRMKRLIAMNGKFSRQDYLALSRRIDEGALDKDTFVILLLAQFPNMTEALEKIQETSSQGLKGFFAKVLYRAHCQSCYPLSVSLDAVLMLCENCNAESFQAFQQTYLEETTPEVASILCRLEDFDRFHPLLEQMRCDQRSLPVQRLHQDGYKLAALFGIDAADEINKFFDCIADLKPVVQDEMKRLTAQLLSIDFDKSVDFAALPKFWKGLIATIDAMKNAPGRSEEHRIGFMENLIQAGIVFKCSKQGDYRALNLADKDNLPDLDFFPDHKERLWGFLEKHIAIPAQTQKPVSEILRPLVQLLKALEQKRTDIDEVDLLLSVLEKASEGRRWHVYHLSKLLSIFQGSRSYPISVLKSLFQERVLSAKSIDELDEEFPEILAKHIKLIMENVPDDSLQQIAFIQLLLIEYRVKSEITLLPKVMELNEKFKWAQRVVLNYLPRGKDFDEINRRFEDCSELLRFSQDFSEGSAPSLHREKTLEVWLDHSNDESTQGLFEQIRKTRCCDSTRELIYYITAWSALDKGLQHQPKKASKLIGRLEELPKENLERIAGLYPGTPSPNTDDLLRLIKRYESYKRVLSEEEEPNLEHLGLPIEEVESNLEYLDLPTDARSIEEEFKYERALSEEAAPNLEHLDLVTDARSMEEKFKKARFIGKDPFDVCLDIFVNRPHKPRMDHARIAATREVDLERILGETQLTEHDGTRRSLSDTEKAGFRKKFGELKKLESGETRVDGYKLSEMPTPALQRAFQERFERQAGSDDLDITLFAMILEMQYRTLEGRYLNAAQQAAFIISDVALTEGKPRVLQIGTGEGKTNYIAVEAVLHVCRGREVDICTANRSLAERDQKICRPFFEALGLTSRCIQATSSLQDYEESQIRYSTGDGFSLFFDSQSYSGSPVQKGSKKRVLLSDEFDASFFEEGAKTQYNYARPTGKTPKQMMWFYRAVNDFYGASLTGEEKITREILDDFISFMRRKAGEDSEKTGLVDELLQSSAQCVRWLQSAYQTDHLKQGVHFTVCQEVIGQYLMRVIVPLSTDNQPMHGATFSDGTQQLLAVRLNGMAKQKGELQDYHVPCESLILSTKNFHHSLKEHWDSWEGFTATVSHLQAGVLGRKHQTQILHVPTNRPTLRDWSNPVFCKDSDDFWDQIAEQLGECYRDKKSVLLACRDDQQVAELEIALKLRFSEEELGHVIFHTTASSEAAAEAFGKKKASLEASGSQGTVIVASPSCGRGVDIDGIQVVLVLDTKDENDLLQKGGRTARNGAEGKVHQFYLEENLRRREEYLLSALDLQARGEKIPGLEQARGDGQAVSENEQRLQNVLYLEECLSYCGDPAGLTYQSLLAQYSTWGMKCIQDITDSVQRQQFITFFNDEFGRLNECWIDISSQTGSTSAQKIGQIQEQIVKAVKTMQGCFPVINHSLQLEAESPVQVEFSRYVSNAVLVSEENRKAAHQRAMENLATKYTTDSITYEELLGQLQSAIQLYPEQGVRLCSRVEVLAASIDPKVQLPFLRAFFSVMQKATTPDDWNTLNQFFDNTESWWNKDRDFSYKKELSTLWMKLGNVRDTKELFEWMKWGLCQQGNSWFRLPSVILGLTKEQLEWHQGAIQSVVRKFDVDGELTKREKKELLKELVEKLRSMPDKCRYAVNTLLCSVSLSELGAFLKLSGRDQTALLNLIDTAPKGALPEFRYYFPAFKIFKHVSSQTFQQAWIALSIKNKERFDCFLEWVGKNLESFEGKPALAYELVLKIFGDKNISIDKAKLLAQCFLSVIGKEQPLSEEALRHCFDVISGFASKSPDELSFFSQFFDQHLSQDTKQLLYDGVARHIYNNRANKVPSCPSAGAVLRTVRSFYRAMAENDDPESILGQLGCFSELRPDNPLNPESAKCSRAERILMTQLTLGGVFCTVNGDLELPRRWTAQKNTALQEEIFQRYASYGAAISSKPDEKRRRVQLSEELAAIGLDTSSSGLPSNALRELRRRLDVHLMDYRAAWGKSPEREAQFARLEIGVANLFARAEKDPHFDIHQELMKLYHAAEKEMLEAQASSPEPSFFPRFTRFIVMQNRNGNSRYWDMLARMRHDTVVSWSENASSIRSFANCGKFVKQQIHLIVQHLRAMCSCYANKNGAYRLRVLNSPEGQHLISILNRIVASRSESTIVDSAEELARVLRLVRCHPEGSLAGDLTAIVDKLLSSAELLGGRPVADTTVQTALRLSYRRR